MFLEQKYPFFAIRHWRLILPIVLASAIFAAPQGFSAQQREDPVPIVGDFAVERGIEIFERDRAAWLATDAALSGGLQKTNAIGWITVGRGSVWLVRFVAPCDLGACSVMDVEVRGMNAVARLLDKPAPLPALERSAWNARQLALSTKVRLCTPRYNTVVIPADDGGLHWVVYLLAASTDSDDIVLAGHHRITISGDGKKVLKNEALSKSCLVKKKSQGKSAVVVTHLLDPRPIEGQTHLFQP